MKSDNLLAGGERGTASPSLTQASYHGAGGSIGRNCGSSVREGGAAASLLTRSSKGGP